MSGLKVAFIPSYVAGVVFYRIWQNYEEMCRISRKDKFCVTWYDPDQNYAMHRWEWDLYEKDRSPLLYTQIDSVCRWADIVIWMGLHTQASLDLFKHMKAKHGKIFLTEFDDYIFSIPKYNSAFNSFRPGSDVTTIALSQIKLSDGLIVSTPFLKELYAPFKNNISVIENSIDLSLWRTSSSTPRHSLTIGWVGGGTHNEDHELIKDAVFEILEKHKNVNFKYISGCKCPDFFKNIDRLTWEHVFTGIDKYPKMVISHNFDIGIAPLIDNNFNRCKSNLRWLEYSAIGIPTVASNVGHFKESIEHGKTGFLANTKKEWVEYISKLIESPELRKTIGENAKNTVKEHWNPRITGAKYLRTLREIYNAKFNASNISYADRAVDRGQEQHPILVK